MIIRFRYKDKDLFERSRRLREKVFVEEQKVDPALEFENEEESRFYLLTVDGKDVATARWRETSGGYKLERFVTLKEERGKGYGKMILEEMLKDVLPFGKKIYLNAQTQALPFYEKSGFVKTGEPFMEAGIEHYLMIYSPEETFE